MLGERWFLPNGVEAFQDRTPYPVGRRRRHIGTHAGDRFPQLAYLLNAHITLGQVAFHQLALVIVDGVEYIGADQ